MMRKTPLRPTTSLPLGTRRPLTKRGRNLKKRGKKHGREWLRKYGSKERVEFVKSLPCCWCRLVGFSENAHTVTGGVGRKADATTVAPLCSIAGNGCHVAYDQYIPPFDSPDARDLVKGWAPQTEWMWQQHIGSLLHTTDPVCVTCGASFREDGEQCASCAYQPCDSDC